MVYLQLMETISVLLLDEELPVEDSKGGEIQNGD